MGSFARLRPYSDHVPVQCIDPPQWIRMSTHHPASPSQPSTLSQIPSSCPPTPIIIAARWTGYGRYSWKRVGTPKTHVYRLATIPGFPISEGCSIKMYAVTQPAFYSPLYNKDDVGLYDPHVRGAVTGIVPSEEDIGRAIVTVVNECQHNTIQLVQIDVPCHPHILLHPIVTCSSSIPHVYHNHLLSGLLDPKSIEPAQWTSICRGIHCVQPVHVADARILFPYQRGVGPRSDRGRLVEQLVSRVDNQAAESDEEEDEIDDVKKRKAKRRIYMSFSTMQQVPTIASDG